MIGPLRLCATFLAFLATGCVPPSGLHGVAAFDAWVARNVTIVHNVDLSMFAGTPCGGYNSKLLVIAIDDACIRIQDPTGALRLAEWTLRHEEGHAVDQLALGFARGVSGCNGVTCRSFEETAQCIAEIVTGFALVPDPVYTPPDVALARGYWDCSDQEVERIRGLMVPAGVW